MTKNSRTRQEVIDASEHLCYEIWMLHQLGITLANGLPGKGPILNAFINSFAVHVRNLVDFLFDNKGNAKGDAILAEHYFDKPEDWASIRPERSERLKQAKIRCEKQVAHLTFTRQKKEPWNFIEVIREIHSPLSVFIENVDLALLGTHFSSIKALFSKDKR